MTTLQRAGWFLAGYFLITGSLFAEQATEPAKKVWPRRDAVVEAVEKTGPAVVNIQAERVVKVRVRNPLLDDPFFDDFFKNFGGIQKRKSESQGSGVIVDPSGIVITNQHVVEGASKIQVILKDKRTLEAALIAEDPGNDIAVLKVESDKPLPTAPVGASADLMIGETLIALGNPFGLQNTVTVGVVSAVDRSIFDDEGKEAYKHLIQTDAAINPGNSGGALLNINGELIGINSAILAKGQGLGFAIPIDQVRRVLLDILNVRHLNEVWTGIQWEEKESHLVIGTVEADSPASKAGLKTGDVLAGVENGETGEILALLKALYQKKPGAILSLKVLREGKALTTLLTLTKPPVPETSALIAKKLGIETEPLTRGQAKRLGLQEGLPVVTKVAASGAAATAGLKTGDIIISLGTVKTDTQETLGKILERTEKGGNYLIRVVRDQSLAEGPVKITE